MSEERKDDATKDVNSKKSKDFLLCSLVSTVNKSPLSLSITLTVGGSVISGKLVSGKEYMESVAARYKSLDDEIGTILSDTFLYVGDKLYSNPTNEGNVLPDMIHLNDAVLFQGNARFNLGNWRGKISAVDGFAMGKPSE
ncbi:gas vesicle accessory protein GvpU [Paenibacillus azoreducens]|uniref:gas vesicle accessory protein GvpU n=1 Tax=Paenibacillus azoreducens TaxID=116718 RepID=UPI0039F50C2D